MSARKPMDFEEWVQFFLENPPKNRLAGTNAGAYFRGLEGVNFKFPRGSIAAAAYKAGKIKAGI